MSEERGKRDGDTPESADSGSVDESAVTDRSTTSSVPAEESPTGAAPAGKPSGKRVSRRAGTAAPTRKPQSTVVAASATGAGAKSVEKSGKDKPRTENIFKRMRRFLREVIAELRKVIWPNRKQMITYTSVVLVFVAFMVTFISLLDIAFLEGVSWLFG